jgi:Cytochrome P460
MLDNHRHLVWLGCVLLGFAACGSDDDPQVDGDAESTERGATERAARDARAEDSDQLPPLGEAAVEAWLETGAYEDWHCEADVHESRSPSPHGYNRICSNDAIAAMAQGSGDWPKGAAAVKELYASESATEPTGYAVYVKTEEESAGGANWYWYERLPPSGAAADEPGQLVADGMGDSGPAKTICVSCHAAAGADPMHTPSVGGRDQVYTPVD